VSQSSPPLAPMKPGPAGRPGWVRWHIVALLVGISFMTWFNRVSMSVAYDEQIKDLYGVSPEAIGTVYSAFLFAYMVCMTPGGWLIDRYGARAALVVMGFGSAVFGALTALAGVPALVAAGLLLPTLLIVRSLMGAFTAPVYPASSRIVSRWIPASGRAYANGLVQGAAAIGIASTYPGFGALIDGFGWQTAFVISGAVTAALALAWMVYAANRPAEHPRVNDAELRHIVGAVVGAEAVPDDSPAPAAWHTLLRHRGLMLLTLSYAAVGYVEYLFYFWMHFYFQQVLHLDDGASRVYAAILTLALAVGMVAGGAASDRLQARYGRGRGRAIVPVIGLVGGAGLLLLGILAQDVFWIVTLLALALAGERGGTAAAICNTGGNAGGLIAPVLTPLVGGWVSRQFAVGEQTGWQWAIGLGVVIALAGAAVWYWIVPECAERG
jgi:MFS transporter, ACS family, D-galactonate transporter